MGNQPWRFEDLSAGTLALTNLTLVSPTGVTVGSGVYLVGGLTGTNNAGAATTKYDLSADLVQLRNPTTGTILVKTNTGTITNDTGVAGSTANGRDQSGAFSASSWIHFYFIAKDDGTLATLSSAVAPPTGPTLPSTYTMWAYAGAVRFNGSSQLLATTMRGAWAYYSAGQIALSGGTATTETAISLTALVPPNVGRAAIELQASTTAAVTTGPFLTIRFITGQNFAGQTAIDTAAASGYVTTLDTVMPVIGQQIFYLWNVSTGSPSANIYIQGYSVPNGGE